MVVSTGWLGITLSNERMGRNLAIIFGLGAGLIGDEVGLLLTFGNYTSNLTEIFFVAAIAFIILVTLLSRGREHIEREVINISRKERLTQIGVFIAAFSVIFFAVEYWAIGLVVLALGVLVYLWGFERERRPRSLKSLAFSLLVLTLPEQTFPRGRIYRQTERIGTLHVSCRSIKRHCK